MKKLANIFLTILIVIISIQYSFSQTELWGTCLSGGVNNYGGVLFKYTIETNTLETKVNFNDSTGWMPMSNIIYASNDKIYGMTSRGGDYNFGVLYEYDTKTNNYRKLHSFNNLDGQIFGGFIMITSNGNIFGLTRAGGTYDKGVLFEYDINNDTFNKRWDFDGSLYGDGPIALIQISNKYLYGITKYGGIYDEGTIFKYNIFTKNLIKLSDFEYSTDMTYPNGALCFRYDKIIGVTYFGGGFNNGTVFSFDTTSNTLTKEADFVAGAYPNFIMNDVIGTFIGTTRYGGDYNAGTIFEFYGDPLNDIYNKYDFDSINGYEPNGNIVQFNVYAFGVTKYGGQNGKGVIYKYNFETNTYTKLYDFDDINGSYPVGLTYNNQTKIHSIKINNLIKIHPNPANQMLYVDYDKVFTMEIYNITGKKVMISNNKESNISKLKAGLYQVIIKDKKGKILKTEKLIIQ